MPIKNNSKWNNKFYRGIFDQIEIIKIVIK